MNPLSPPKSWAGKHPFVVIGVILAGSLVPFANRAVQMDDLLFVRTAEWIQHHPADFFGFNVHWWFSGMPMWVANLNPPTMSYFLAGAASLFGWSEVALHLACLPIAFAAAAGIYALAQRWCDRPLLAAIIGIVTPAFLVSSTTLMCDVLMLAFWTWTLVLWERALAGGPNRWLCLAVGVLAGLAVLTKYSAINLLPLLAILGVLRTRKAGWWLVGIAVPLLMLVGYEWLTARMYGHALFLAALRHTHNFRFGFPGGLSARVMIALAFAGGSVLPLLFFAPWLWRGKILLAGGTLILGSLLGAFWLGADLGLMHSWADPKVLENWGFRLQLVVFVAGGLQLLLLAGVEIWQRRDVISAVLALWIAVIFLFAALVNWTINARSFLPAVPAAAILVARRFGAEPLRVIKGGWWWLPLAPAAVITLGVMWADYQLADSGRKAAEQIVAKYKPADHQLWVNGHNGFQYYLEKLGAQSVDVQTSLLQPGDVIAVSWTSSNFIQLPSGSVGPLETVMPPTRAWMNLQSSNGRTAAGFYTSDWGPVPFAFGALPTQEYLVVKVFSRVQYRSQPANPKEIADGEVPSFPKDDYFMEGVPFSGKPGLNPQIEAAFQCQQDGKLEEAIQRYREILNADTNNPAVLNNLAWILATAGKPALRDSKQAVQLANRAVELTEGRQPIMIVTLAAACAADGQFARATSLARLARDLALLTGQSKVVELVDLWASGKVISM